MSFNLGAGGAGSPGTDGKTVRNGNSAPSTSVGVDGDFYINTSAVAIYGPKSASAWGSATPLTGSAGAAGADGKTIRNGTSAPSTSVGVDGDFYINTVTDEIYGPKSASAWGSPTSLMGADGITTIDWKGEFVSTSAYVPGNFVKHSAQTYINLVSSTGDTPPGSTWDSFPFVNTGTPLTIQEIDGSPLVTSVTTIRFTNGSLTDDGGGQVTISAPAGGSPLTVKEVDGAPNVTSVTTIRFPNGSLTDDGSGQVTISVASGGDPKTAWYPTFTPGSNDDEFDDGVFSGWTSVNPGTTVPTVTETNDVASLLHPGGGSSMVLWAYMKSYSPSVNDYIEIAFRFAGINQNYSRVGLVFANGVTYGAGTQCFFGIEFTTRNFFIYSSYTNYNNDGGGGSPSGIFNTSGGGVHFLRLKYEGSNHFRGYVSPDGISWADVTGQITVTLTPTHIGFAVTPYGGAGAFVASMNYFKQSA